MMVMRRGIALLLLVLVALQAAQLELIYSKITFGWPIWKVDSDCKTYTIGVTYMNYDDASYCCGKIYQLDDDEVRIFKATSVNDDPIPLGKVSLDEDFDKIVAVSDGFVVCKDTTCVRYLDNGTVLWRATLQGSGLGDADLEYVRNAVAIPLEKGIVYLDPDTGSMISYVSFGREVTHTAACGSLQALSLKGELGDSLIVLNLSDIEHPKVILNRTRSWHITTLDLSHDCRYLLVTSLQKVYVLRPTDGEVLASKMAAEGTYFITASNICKVKDDVYTIGVVAVDLNSLSSITDLGGAWVALYGYLLTQ
ncbi:hypothetical protein IPA_06255 [Ignicoccus pacificus DSM 13166]|uniref:Uncharacterized protein n=1 Tax=Ignicoccus pacificus DSM 13166 TaxID=940294 RepID=A0A977KBE2_9CREN|nr:hypothetical protein IPA_06255 [Ignicoccus pacificus DSM 13166]